MIDNIIGLVKDQVLNSVTGSNIDLPADKKNEVVDIATNSMVDSLKSSFTLDNLSSLASMFTKGETNNSITDGIQSSVLSALTNKAGLSSDMSKTIASTVVPAVMAMFQKKANDPNDSDFDLQSLIKSFASSKGGILGMLGGLFGK